MKKYFYLYLSVLIVSFGGFLSGYDTGVISGALLYIRQEFDIQASMAGFLVASISLGAVIGALINGYFVDKFGRRKVLIAVGFIFGLGSILCFFSQNIFHLIFARMIIGCAVGAVSFVAPLYLSEISHKDKRGQIVSFYQLCLTFGILFSYFVNYFCSFSSLSWRLMLFIGVIPAFILLFGMIFRADTPRWLVLNGFENKAKLVLQKLSFGDDIDAEILKIKNLQNDKKEMVFEKKLFKPLIIGIGIMFFQIATGINSIIYYAPVIFKMTGFAANEDAILVTILIGVINFLMTFVAIILVDRIGRKPLLYFGLFGMLIGLIVLAGVFAFDFPYNKLLSVLSVIVYIVSFSASLGPIALLLISEIFPLKYRGRAMGVAIVSNFVFNFIVTGAFPILLDKIGGCATFLIFAFIVILAFLFVYFCVPETKGKSLEDIEMQC